MTDPAADVCMDRALTVVERGLGFARCGYVRTRDYDHLVLTVADALRGDRRVVEIHRQQIADLTSLEAMRDLRGFVLALLDDILADLPAGVPR